MEDWKKIEALLFASGKYLTEDQLIQLSGIPKTKIKKVLTTLTNKYEEFDTSLKIYNEADAWKLNVKEEYTDVIREVVSDAEMPRAVMETLAVIAYKSPVLQSEIKDIRGASVYEHISLLESKGFINREKHGRSYKIRLASKFHEYFDIDEASKLAELFKDVKKPDLDKLGNLEVYKVEENNDNGFTEKILERMKKLEKTSQDTEQENTFLNDFEEKFEKTKQNINESEQDIASFRKKTDEDTKQIFGDEPIKISAENDEENDEVQDDESEINKEKFVDEEGNPLPGFIDKINKQIDALTEGRDEKRTKIPEEEQDSDDEEDLDEEDTNEEDNEKKE